VYDFIDRVLECESGQRIVAIKALALNEEFFQDHFPGAPVLPGAMILEGFVQAARRCLDDPAGGGSPWILHAAANLRFNRFVSPGDVLRLEAKREESEGGATWFSGHATCDGETVCRVRFAVRRRAEGH